ncbi:MAG: hypothetical protein K0S46_1007 [Moraxellaceae bacterium]|nr:hypothetical protein [Moraxellaceae bacterium]
MSWRHHARRAGRHIWRVFLVVLLLAVLLAGAVLAVLGSETGSRWLLEQGLGMQKTLSARYQRGTWLGGLELVDVRIHTRKTDVRIRHLLARWTVWQLLRGTFQVESLRLRDVDIYKLTAPTDEPTQLPTLLLPVRLVVRQGEATDIRYWRWQAKEAQVFRRLELADARWAGTRVRFRQLALDHARLGRLELGGQIRVRGPWRLTATGAFDYLPFRDKGWRPLTVQLGGSLEQLAIRLESTGGLTAVGEGRLQPLQPDMPYQASLQWQKVSLPWWSDQMWRSEGGNLKVTGNRDGLRGEGSAQLSSLRLPPGRYAVKGSTDWRSAVLDEFNFNGLGGVAKGKGELDWRLGLKWQLQSQLTRIDLRRKWKVPELAVPVLTGELSTTGHTKSGDSDIVATLRLTGGESWELVQHGRDWPWKTESPQRLWLRWSGVDRRLEDGRRFQSASGELQAEGSRRDYRAQADFRLAGDGVPAGQWGLTVAGVERRLAVSRLDYAGDAGQLGFQGELDLVGPVLWRGEFSLGNFATAWLRPDWPAHLSGRLAGSGAWSDRRREFDFEEAHLEGDLRAEPFRLDGPLELALVPEGWPAFRSSNLSLQWGGNQAVLLGGLRDGHWDLAAQLDLGNLKLLHSDLGGRLTGPLALQGAERRPDIQANLKGEGVAFRGWRAKSVAIDGNVLALGDAESKAALTLAGVINPAGRELGNARLDLAGTRARHALQWQAAQADMTGRGSLAGSWLSTGWSGQMESGFVNLPDLYWALEAPFALDWSRAGREIRLAPHCWVSGEARLCNEDDMRLGTAGHVKVALSGLRLERLASLMPEGLQAQGLLTGAVAGDWAAGQRPSLSARLDAGEGSLRLLREDARSSLTLGFQRIALSADAGGRAVDLRFDLQSADMGQGWIAARVDPYADGRPLQGELALAGLRLEVFQPFFPALSTLAGTFSAEGRLAGVLARPDFHGRIQLRDGEMGFQRLPLHIRNIASRIDVNGTNAVINGSMQGGEGKATLAGRADWSAEPWLELALSGERFELRQPPELLAAVDPDLRLRVVPGRADLTGSVRVPMARLNLKPLTDQAVPLSPDIRVVSAADRERIAVVGRVESWDINADIRLVLGDDVYFHGYGVNGRVMGGLRLRQEGRRGLEANGEVELDREARYDAYGQRLEIRRGRLIFAGNLTQPGLDVEAIREIDNKVVGVRMQGRANAPEATLFADTPMSQEEIVSYLVLGRPLDTTTRESGSGGNLAAAAAAIKLGATGGAGITTKVGETIGITDFAVDAEGSGDDTQFTVSGYLSPKLYLRYGVGIFTPVNTATLRYKINSRLYLEAVSSLESAIDLFYNWRF